MGNVDSIRKREVSNGAREKRAVRVLSSQSFGFSFFGNLKDYVNVATSDANVGLLF